ncbi:hypothetical protein [Chromobacterium vaccinii]|uniref:hypothetical protein n=1 Tax=Chromobacterium vaccinii TaxID=1108595 RepID=UPI0006182681|nr:hypothetical protein [Chromobacterium vaccinii]
MEDFDAEKLLNTPIEAFDFSVMIGDVLDLLLRHFTREAGIDAEHMLQNYEALVHVRNCIAHSAGLHATYKHGESLCNEINRLSGIYFGNWHFLGDQICIERGALTPYMHQMADFLPKLYASLRAKSMLTD